MQRTIPLFLLNTILFPGATIPLQIFEERYKLLLQDCLDADHRFGITLIKSGKEVGEPAIPYNIGTIARITQVNQVQDGRFFIAVTGEQRFEINSITQTRPYPIAQIQTLPEQRTPEATAHRDAIQQPLNRYLNLLSGLQGGWSSETQTPDDPTTLSYHIAQTLILDHKEKQSLLELPTTAQRLQSEIRIIGRDMEALRQKVEEEMRGKFSRQ